MEDNRVILLLEAYNLLVQSTVEGLKGGQLARAGAIMEGFRQLTVEFAEGTLTFAEEVTEGEADETT